MIDPCGTPQKIFPVEKYLLVAIKQVTSNPFMWNSGNAKIKKFFNDRGMANCIKSFAQVNANSTSEHAIIHCFPNLISEESCCQFSWAMFSETKLKTR